MSRLSKRAVDREGNEGRLRGRAEEFVIGAPKYKAPPPKDKVGAGFLPADPSIATTFFDLLTPDPGGLGG